MEKEKAKKGPGRPRLYPARENDKGAPKFTVRVAPDVHEHIQSRPEGPRAYIERVVRKDRDEESATGSLPLVGDAEQAAEA